MKSHYTYFPHLGLAALIFLLYCNTFTTPFVFDDVPNITNNLPLQIDNLMPETLWRTFFATPFDEGKLYRPLACLTFALNWYIGHDNTIGYHIVNLFIHYCTALFLFLTVLQLFQTPVLKDTYKEKSRYYIALLTAVFWAINPIQTQAITYIVQRMASMATLFFLVALYCYIKGRLDKRFINRYFFYCIISFILALGSKENTILLPFSLLLVEYLFFFSTNEETSKKFITILTGISLVIIILGSIFLLKSGIIADFFNIAGSRPYTYYERLLTESRVLFFYLGLIFYPIPARLSTDHDIALSTSLLAPWTTLLSVLALLFLFIFGIQQSRKRPLLSLAILFFFLNHLVESTVIPLEVVFEHRNYLPSLFLFLPVATGLYVLQSQYSITHRFLYHCINVFIVLLILFIGMGTYIRNMAYSSSEELWKDSLQKAPNSARALSTLGILTGWGKEHSSQALEKALAFNIKASKSMQQRSTYLPAIFGNIGGIYYNYGLFNNAIEYYKKSIALNPSFINGHYNLARTYLRIGELRKALDEINLVVENAPPESRYFSTQGLILLWNGEPEKALQACRNSMRLSKKKEADYYGIGTSLSLAGYYKQANWFLERAKSEERTNLRIALSVLENSARSGNPLSIQKAARYLFENFDMASIADAMKALPTDRRSAPVDISLIRPIVMETAKNLSVSLFTE